MIGMTRKSCHFRADIQDIESLRALSTCQLLAGWK